MKAKLMLIACILGCELTVVLLIAAGMSMHDLIVAIRENKIKMEQLKEMEKELKKKAMKQAD